MSMRKRLAIALGLSSASLALAATFGILMWTCGAMEQGASSGPGVDDAESYGPRCVSVFHPGAPVWAVFAIAGGVALWFGKAWPAVALGAIGLALGILSGFSAGFYGIGCGALLLAAGIVGRKGAPSDPTNKSA